MTNPRRQRLEWSAGFPAARLVAILLLASFLLHGCSSVNRRMTPAGPRLDPPRGVLKVHLRDGGLVILDHWRVASTPPGEPAADTLIGTGTRFDPARQLIGTDEVRLTATDVVLIETNRAEINVGRTLGGLVLGVGVVVLGIGLVVLIACAADPKCFGSCPTFYVTDGDRPSLMAEGFSASIAPSLEATDVDALWRARPRGRMVEVVMRNEALETHVVRSLRLLALPRGDGRVMQTVDGAFHRVTDVGPPLRAIGEDGDGAAALAQVDGEERFRLADSTDLGAHERILLDYGAVAGPGLGIAISHRQSLVMTWLLYQTLAWMGAGAGEHIARMERGDARWLAMARGAGQVLGPIEVQVREPGAPWRTIGTVDETGPIATDLHLVPLPPLAPGTQIGLWLTRGHWRLDAARLVRIGPALEPVRLAPVLAVRDSLGGARADEQALAGAPLVTMPGQSVIFRFELPEPAERCELFLESRGYYLEWVREPWLRTGDPLQLAGLVTNPRAALRRLAPAFKREEASIERAFWGSRAAHP